MRIAPYPKNDVAVAALTEHLAATHNTNVSSQLEKSVRVDLRPPFLASSAPGVNHDYLKSLLSHVSYEAGSVYCYIYYNSLLVPQSGGVVIKQDWLDSDTLYNDAAGDNCFVENAGYRVPWNFDQRDTNLSFLDGLSVLAGNRWSSNYRHWHTECLPAILALLPYVKHLNPRWVLPEIREFHVQSLHALGISADKVVAADGQYLRCERLALVTTHFERTWVSPFASRMLLKYRMQLLTRGNAGGMAMLAGDKPDRKTPELLRLKIPQRRRLYVSRSDSQFRSILNEPELENCLREYGFEPVINSKLSVVEQALLFSNAEIVVGAHGAGLTNALFCPTGSILLELRPDNVLGRSPFWDRSDWSFAHATGLQYGAVCFPANSDSESWTVDIDHLRKVLNVLGWR